MKLKNILIIILALFNSASATKYSCEHSHKGGICILRVTNEIDSIEPVSKSPMDSYNEVDIKGSVKILKKGVCEPFPKLTVFTMLDTAIEEIAEDAFEGCDKIIKLNLRNNGLKVGIDKNAFKPLTSLVTFFCGVGNLGAANFDLSGSKNLQVFVYYAQNAKNYYPELLKENINLQRLAIYSNRLMNLNIEKIVKFAPKLKILDIADNNLRCKDVQKILEYCKKRKIEVRSFLTEDYVRKRDYTPEKLQGIHCLNDKQFKEEFNLDSAIQTINEQGLEVSSLGRVVDNMEDQVDLLEKTFEKLRERCGSSQKSDLKKVFAKLKAIDGHMWPWGLWILAMIDCFLIVGLIVFLLKKMQEKNEDNKK